MKDDVVRGSIVLNKGVKTWPPNPPISVAAAVSPKAAAAVKGIFNQIVQLIQICIQEIYFVYLKSFK